MSISTPAATAVMALSFTVQAPAAVPARPDPQPSVLRLAVGRSAVASSPDRLAFRSPVTDAVSVADGDDDLLDFGDSDEFDFVSLTEADAAMLRSASLHGIKEFDFSEFYDSDDE